MRLRLAVRTIETPNLLEGVTIAEMEERFMSELMPMPENAAVISSMLAHAGRRRGYTRINFDAQEDLKTP